VERRFSGVRAASSVGRRRSLASIVGFGVRRFARAKPPMMRLQAQMTMRERRRSEGGEAFWSGEAGG
jgi:hypothetical protein